MGLVNSGSLTANAPDCNSGNCGSNAPLMHEMTPLLEDVKGSSERHGLLNRYKPYLLRDGREIGVCGAITSTWSPLWSESIGMV